MWMGSVDVPQALIDAHQRGELVIFVGAGASMGPPANLPDFDGLTAEIAADANVVFVAGRDSPDVVLGRADSNPLMDVHIRIAEKIDDPDSLPNALHKAIAALVVSGAKIRVVTTNYDRHLTTVLAGHDIEEYRGPALPMGDDFEGLVYLHGTLTQEPRHMIATDEDFGRAYLRDAWAARFLERMFATYTVLFIGYSHNDLVMTYLARSLRDTSKRFALVPEPPAEQWERLRIVPVAYPKVGGSHAALTDVVQKWANRASMGLLEHRQQVALLLSGSPSSVPEETSYLESILARDDTVGFFAEYARTPEWLAWAAARPQLRQLFDGSPGGRQLAYWFAEHYVMVQEHTAAALEIVRAAGGRLGPEVWSAIGHQMHMQHGDRPGWLGPWLVLLARDAPDFRDLWLGYALAASRWPQDRASALLLFDRLTEPRAVFTRSFVSGRPAALDVQILGDQHWLREAWQEFFVPALADVAEEILVIVEGHLRRAHRIAVMSGVAGAGWDPLSFGRSAIEAHPQDRHRDPIDPLIDAARDCLETLLGTPPGTAYLGAWASSDVPLLRRLAVHGWTERRDLNPTAKIAALREHNWLADRHVWHEAMRLIATAVGDTHQDTAEALVADVVAAPEPPPLDDYRKFTLLAWINQHAPNLATARHALSKVRAAHPNYAEREHPDLLSWSESGFVGDRQPISEEELHNRIGSDPAAAVDLIRGYEDVEFSFDKPTRQDALNVLTATVSTHPRDGFEVLDATHSGHVEIAAAVVRGWSAADLDDTTATAVIQRLTTLQLSGNAHEIAGMLANFASSDDAKTAWHEVAGARQLATAVWDALDSNPADTQSTDDWLTAAINHPAGWLTEFWIEAVASDWRQAGDTWTRMPDELRQPLEALIADADDRAAMAQVVIASRLHLLHSADHEWTERYVLPLLDWTDTARARRAWDGFLAWGRWNNRLLEAGLLNSYLQAAQHVGDFRDDIADRIAMHLAAVAIHADTDPITAGWAQTFTRTANTETRTAWLDDIGQLLADLDPGAVEQQWSRWLRTYWTERLNSKPIALTDDEASAVAALTVYLTDSIEEGVAMAQRHTAHVRPHSRLLHDLPERVHHGPVALAKLVTHLLRGTEPPFDGAFQLPNVVRALKAHVDVKKIIEQAVRLGRSDAPTW